MNEMDYYRTDKCNIRHIFSALPLLLAVVLSSCSPGFKYPSPVQAAMRKAGSNRKQLAEVIAHYRKDPADSLKLRAAYFLIANMPGHYTWHGAGLTINGNGANSYEMLAKMLHAIALNPESDEIKSKEINHLYYQLNISEVTSTLHLEPDLKTIQASYLIDNIDNAFKAWRSYPWSQQVSFHDFRNYILPYSIFTEPLTVHWREKIMQQFSWVADSLQHPRSLRAATRLINQSISDSMSFSSAMVKVPDALSFNDLQEAKMGKCDHLVTYNAYILRAMGIPARVDYVTARPTASMGHTWLSIKDNEGKLYAFDPMYSKSNHHYTDYDSIPGQRLFPQSRAPKVFRRTYRIQHSGSVLPGDSSGCRLPPNVINRHKIDATAAYRISSADIKIFTKPGYKNKRAWLAVYSARRWKVIAPGERAMDGSYIFKNMGTGIVYLPFGCRAKKLIPISPPVLLTSKNIHLLVPRADSIRTIRIKRKYPIRKYVKKALKKMIGGVFQGATRKDFSDAITLYTIHKMPQLKMNIYRFSNKGRYRYLRFMLPDERCRVAGMQFFGIQTNHLKNIPLIGKLISSSYQTGKGPQNIRDGKALTYFVASTDSGGWVGVNLGQKRRVGGVRFYPPNDGNSIHQENIYELFYWDDKWISLGKKQAQGEQLFFKNAPENALFLLRDLTKGKEVRIFIYRNGRQIWY
jgi:hypothetical protein